MIENTPSEKPTYIKVLYFNEQDIQWLESVNRTDFDKPREAYQKQELVDIIERSLRLGLFDLAAQMQDDLLVEFGPHDQTP